MALPPLELFSLKKEAALLPGGFFRVCLRLILPSIDNVVMSEWSQNLDHAQTYCFWYLCCS
jgi:hypothetical protein